MKIFPHETLEGFCEAMDRQYEVFLYHFPRVLANGRMPKIKDNLDGQLSAIESKLRAVMERREN